MFKYDQSIKLYIGTDSDTPPYVVPKSELRTVSRYFDIALSHIHYDSGDPPTEFTCPEGDELGWTVFAAWLYSHRIPSIDSANDDPEEYYRALLHAYQVSKDLQADGFRDGLICAFSVSSVECDVPTVIAKEILEVTPAGDALRQLAVHRIAVAGVRDGCWECHAWLGQYTDAFVQLLEESRVLSGNYDDTPPSNCSLHGLGENNRDDTPFSSCSLDELDWGNRDDTPASDCSPDDVDQSALLTLP